MSSSVSCPSCGAPVPGNSRFCAECGASMAGIPATGNTQAAERAAAASKAKETGEGTVNIPPPDAPTAHMDALPPATPPAGELLTQSRIGDALTRATLGEYEILAELGRGGMATVYLAHDIALDRKVAIKVMSPALLDGEGAIERFKREARTAGNLSHPHIIPIHAVRESGDLLYFVMKYVEGRPLDEVIKAQGGLPVRMVVQILSEVAGALAYAHRKGVVHRDVKPANVMLDDDGWAVVTDFGIAKVVQKQGLTMTGTTVGTPAYMSPEQCIARDVTGLADQYSLGIVAWEMLAGHVPFRAESLLEMMMAQMNDAPPPLLDVRPDCPPALAAIVTRMVAKQPEDRWPALDDVVSALAGLQTESAEQTRVSIRALAREGGGRPRPSDFTRPVSPTPLNRPSRAPAPATTPLELPRASTPARGLPLLLGGLGAAIAIAIAGWLATRDPAGPAAAPAAATATVAEAPPLRVARITITPAQASIGLGSVAALAVTLADSLGRAVTGRALDWSSADSTVASVDASGVVAARRAGTTTVTARIDGRVATVAVTVTEKALVPAAVALTPRDTTLTVGARLAMVANVTGEGGAAIIGAPLTWRSSAPAVVSVDAASGAVAALKAGSADISAGIRNGPGARVRLTVINPPVVAAVPPPVAAPAVNADSLRADSAARAAAAAASAGTLFTAISAGGSTTCGALANDSGVLCWGSTSVTGAKLDGVLFSKLAVGDGHICGLTPAGEAYCWGANSQGQLGDGSTAERDRPTPVKAQQGFAEISVGAGHTCALTRDGTAFCWGGNKYGQLGDGSRTNRSRPVLVLSTAGNQGFQSLAAGGSHTCGVTRANKAFCWGDGFSGQVGNAMQDFAKEPFAVKTDLSFRSVVAGDRHTCGLTTSGRAYCWGSNTQGQLGNETKDDRNVPDSVATDQVFRALSAGGSHSCGISTRRQLWCWGHNVDGRLGDGTRSTRIQPVLAAGGQAVTLVSAGSGHTCALTGAGSALCWGANGRGQLGGGSASPFSPSPVTVRVRGS